MSEQQTSIRNGFYFILLLTVGHFVKGLLTIFGHFPILLDLQMGYFNLLVGMAYFGFYIVCAKVNIVSGFSSCFIFYLVESGIMLIMAVQRAPYFLVLMIAARIIIGTFLFLAYKRVTSLQEN